MILESPNSQEAFRREWKLLIKEIQDELDNEILNTNKRTKMHLYEKNELKMTSLHIIYEAGSMFEKAGRYGTMHLMEHMICKNYNDLRDSLQELGIVCNAYTAQDYVVFWFKGLESKLSPMKAELVKRITGGFRATDDELQMEKKVVVEEYLDTFNDQIIGNYYNAFRKHYDCYGPIGLRADIEKFGIDDALEVYEEYFSKPTRIVEVGPTQADLSFVNYAAKREYKLKEFGVYDYEPEEVNTLNKITLIAFGKIKCDAANYPALTLGLSMLGDGLNSPLYKEIRENRGLSYFSWCDSMEHGDFVLPLFGACTEKDRINELTDVYNMIFSDVTSYLTKERFSICKNRFTVVKEKREVLRYDNPADLMNYGGLYNLNDIESLTFEEVVKVTTQYVNKDSLEIVIM